MTWSSVVALMKSVSISGLVFGGSSLPCSKVSACSSHHTGAGTPLFRNTI